MNVTRKRLRNKAAFIFGRAGRDVFGSVKSHCAVGLSVLSPRGSASSATPGFCFASSLRSCHCNPSRKIIHQTKKNGLFPNEDNPFYLFTDAALHFKPCKALFDHGDLCLCIRFFFAFVLDHFFRCAAYEFLI